jgi:hypothetical protein
VAFLAGDFWKNSESPTLTVKNTSRKQITNLNLTSEMLLAPQDLRRPYNSAWSWAKPIAPEQEQTLEQQGTRAASAQNILGWVFFPGAVKYEDGTTWRPQSEGECFGVIWRDAQHPEMPVLPTRQFEMNPD